MLSRSPAYLIMHQIERISGQVGLEAEPTRWLSLPPYSDEQWLMVYVVSALVWLLTFAALGMFTVVVAIPLCGL